MRRLPSIAAFILSLALLPASAQIRGGGGAHGSFGGHGGFSGHASVGSHMGGGRSFGGVAPGRGFTSPRFQSRGFSRGSSFRQPFLHGDFHANRFDRDRFRDRFRHDRFRNFGFRNCFGWNCGWGWPWWGAGFYDPYWWWDSGSSYDEDRAREIADANEMNQQSLEEQRQRREKDQDLYAQRDLRQQDPPREAEHSESAVPATVLVFRDQHTQEVQNYAIVGQTLWNFSPQRTQRIPLSDLDIAATQKANDDRGVDFRVPGMGEGQ
jgi:hypothetical protein